MQISDASGMTDMPVVNEQATHCMVSFSKSEGICVVKDVFYKEHIIYPSQLENVIDGHPAVSMSTVIGVPDPYRMQKVKAFIVLREGQEPTEEVKASILEHCRKNIAKYAMPYEFEYRKELPKTLVGKVAFTVLEKEEAEKIKNQQK